MTELKEPDESYREEESRNREEEKDGEREQVSIQVIKVTRGIPHTHVQSGSTSVRSIEAMKCKSLMRLRMEC